MILKTCVKTAHLAETEEAPITFHTKPLSPPMHTVLYPFEILRQALSKLRGLSRLG